MSLQPRRKDIRRTERRQRAGFLVALAAAAGLLVGCAPVRKPPAQPPPQLPPVQPPAAPETPAQKPAALPPSPLVPVSWTEVGPISDDLGFAGLAAACRQSAEYYEKVAPATLFLFGDQTVTAAAMAAALRSLATEAEDKSLSPEAKLEWIKAHFTAYRSVGDGPAESVLFTGYYEPVLRASRVPGGRYLYPLYKRPPDLLEIDLSLFPVKADRSKLYGRLEGGRVVPYYTREEIDDKGALRGRGLELCYLEDPVDRFFLQVQGSGRIVLDDGSSMRVLFDGKNGQPYRSLGKYLVASGKLPKDGVSLDAIKKFLAAHPGEINQDFDVNPSYTFFRFGEGGPYGNIAVALTPGRSIATDASLFPKGAPALIFTEKPRFGADGSVAGYDTFARFVLNQDTGGAITGAGRVDIFFGPGAEAGLAAGQMQQEGRLYFLLPVQEANAAMAR